MAVIGELSIAGGPPTGPVRAPGMLSRHYAPERPLRLEAEGRMAGEVFLAFGATGPAGADLNLSPTGDLEEAAANLFVMLRALDRPGVGAIAVAAVPDVGIGRAINDRLRRAAAGTSEPAQNSGGADWDDERGPAAPCVLPDADDGQD